MRQVTLLNACLFLYVLLSAKPLAETDAIRGLLAIDHSNRDCVYNSDKNKACSKTTSKSPTKLKHVDNILAAIKGTDPSFFTYTAAISLQSFPIQIFQLPIYRYQKTGLSPPLLS